MDQKIQKMPLMDEDEENSGSWFRQNRSMVVAIVIIIILIGGIYALSKKEANPVNEEKESSEGITQENTEEGNGVEVKKEEVKPEEKGKVASVTVPEGKVENDKITEYAEKGQGITHLARKSLNRYLKEVDESVELSNEQKIYVEDYLQNRTGSGSLKIGEAKTFSTDLIKEAIDASKKLTPSQLENLKKYSQMVYFEAVWNINKS